MQYHIYNDLWPEARTDNVHHHYSENDKWCVASQGFACLHVIMNCTYNLAEKKGQYVIHSQPFSVFLRPSLFPQNEFNWMF